MSYSVIKIIDPITLTQESIRCQSVTPHDDGALNIIAKPLSEMGFTVHNLRFEDKDTPPIDNFFARFGTGGKHLCYMGHTDVVPIGAEEDWSFPPFGAIIQNGNLYGRGAADMKGGNCAFVAAVSRFLNAVPDFKDSISLLITGDEEAKSINGTVKVVEWMRQNNHLPDVALVGEPSNSNHMGEIIRVGRRGSLSGKIIVKGIQGHSAYPERSDNPIPHLIRLLSRLITEKLDNGTDDFPPSHIVISSVDVGNPASNIIPAQAEALFNIRFNDKWTAETLESHLRAILNDVNSNYHMNVWSYAKSFVTANHPWRDIIINAVEKISGKKPVADTGGGTSDARFIAGYCPVVEYGLINATIHKVDEFASISDIETLTQTYHEILRSYFR
jgi:succinyl-diaminopimelate desuccinylase